MTVCGDRPSEEEIGLNEVVRVGSWSSAAAVTGRDSGVWRVEGRPGQHSTQAASSSREEGPPETSRHPDLELSAPRAARKCISVA